MVEDFAGNDLVVARPSSTSLTKDHTRQKTSSAPGRRPDMDISEHDDSLASPARNPVFAIKTIIINKQQPSENSGEITDETSRTTRTEEEDEKSQEISDPENDRTANVANIEPPSSPQHGIHSLNSHSKKGGANASSNPKSRNLPPIEDDVNNDTSSTQSPFSVPTVDLFPVDSNHSILTNDDSVTSWNNSKRSNNSMALSPSVSQRARNYMNLSSAPTRTSDDNEAAVRRNPKTPTVRPVERTNSFIQRRNKRLEQIKQRVMSKKQQRIMEEENRLLEQVQEIDEEYEQEEETSAYNVGTEVQPLKSPSTSSHKKFLQIPSPRRTPSKHSPSSSSSPSAHSTPRRCLSADRGRKEHQSITVRDSSPLSTRSESRKESNKIRVRERSSRRSRSRSGRKERSVGHLPEPPASPKISTPIRSPKQVPASVVVQQSPGSQGSSQYRNHRQRGDDNFDHLEEELTVANLIISQQQERIKQLEQSNADLKQQYDEAKQHHEMQLQGSLHALYQLQKKQEKTEQDLQLALKKINSLNELHEAVAKIQQLTGLQLLNPTTTGDDASIKSDGAKSAISAKSAPQLGEGSSPRKDRKDPLPLLEERPLNYVSDASDSTHSELLNEAMNYSGECELDEDLNETSADSFQNTARSAHRRYSGSNVSERGPRTSPKKRVKASSLPGSYAPVVPSRQDQSQASYLDSALNRNGSESTQRRYSLQH